MNFDAINKTVDLKALCEDVKNATSRGNYPKVPNGQYEVAPVKLLIRGTKADPNRPMLSGDFKILTGDFKGSHLFMNRVLYGTRNDANMIRSAVEWLNSLGSGLEIYFQDYKQFNDLVMDVAENIVGTLEYAVTYDEDAFNSITVDEVFETE